MATDIIARGMAASSVRPGSDGKIPAEYLPSYVDDIVDLLAISDTAPATCAEGDKYYNSTSKLIFTATGTNTWGTTGETPETGKIYINTAEDPSGSYRWDGLNLVLIGASGGQTIQYTEMPTAEAAIEGEIVQYIGDTDSTYTNGYFYKCVEDNGTYSWENINVQQTSSSSYKQVYYLTTDMSSCYSATYLNSTDIATLNEFVDAYRSGKDVVIIAKKIGFWYSSGTNGSFYNVIANAYINGTNVSLTFYRPCPSGVDEISFWGNTRTISISNVGTPSNISSAMLPDISSPNEVFNIKGIKRYSNYNAGKKQILQNNNGTISWDDGSISDLTIQYSTMPTASSTNEGKIVQYTGTTTSSYTNGYFYQCVSDGAVTPTYSWEAINVQAGGNSDDDGVFYYDGVVNDANKAMFQKILDRLNAGKGVALYLKNTTGTIWFPCGVEKYDGSGTIYTYPYYIKGGTIYNTPSSVQLAYFSGTTITSINSYVPANIVSEIKVVRDYDNAASGGRTALAINNTKSFIPTGDYNPATKIYVDNSIQKVYIACGLSAYSSSSTYAVGDYVYKDNVVYVCNTAISTAEAWTAAHWTASNLKAYLQSELVGNALGGSY